MQLVAALALGVVGTPGGTEGALVGPPEHLRPADAIDWRPPSGGRDARLCFAHVPARGARTTDRMTCLPVAAATPETALLRALAGPLQLAGRVVRGVAEPAAGPVYPLSLLAADPSRFVRARPRSGAAAADVVVVTVPDDDDGGCVLGAARREERACDDGGGPLDGPPLALAGNATAAAELWRRLATWGLARVETDEGAVRAHRTAQKATTALFDIIGEDPDDLDLASRLGLRCQHSGKMTGFEAQGTDLRHTYLHVRRVYNTTAPFVALADPDRSRRVTGAPYAAVRGRMPELQGALDALFDKFDSMAAALLDAIAVGDGAGPAAFFPGYLRPATHFGLDDPLSDSYFRAFRYLHGDGAACAEPGSVGHFGHAHADVGLLTVAPVADVAGLEVLMPCAVVRPGPGGAALQTWGWMAVEAAMQDRVAAGTASEREWLVFAGETLAWWSAGRLPPLLHRVTVREDVPVTRFSMPFFQRSHAEARLHVPGVTGQPPSMRKFFQQLKQRVYNLLPERNGI